MIAKYRLLFNNYAPWHLPKNFFCPHEILHINSYRSFIHNFPKMKQTNMSFNK